MFTLLNSLRYCNAYVIFISAAAMDAVRTMRVHYTIYTLLQIESVNVTVDYI